MPSLAGSPQHDCHRYDAPPQEKKDDRCLLSAASLTVSSAKKTLRVALDCLPRSPESALAPLMCIMCIVRMLPTGWLKHSSAAAILHQLVVSTKQKTRLSLSLWNGRTRMIRASSSRSILLRLMRHRSLCFPTRDHIPSTQNIPRSYSPVTLITA